MRTDEAARELGVTDRRVRQLVDAGVLIGEQPSPRLVLVDRASVETYKLTRRRRGRPSRDDDGKRS